MFGSQVHNGLPVSGMETAVRIGGKTKWESVQWSRNGISFAYSLS